MSNRIADLAKNTQDVAVTVIILATLEALLMEAAYIFGVRSVLQEKWLERWIYKRKRKNKRKIEELKRVYSRYENKACETKKVQQYRLELAFREKVSRKIDSNLLFPGEFSKFIRNSFYSLPYQKLCGQFSSSIQAELDYSISEEFSLLYIFAAIENSNDLEKIKCFMEQKKYSKNSNLIENQNKEELDRILEPEEMADIRQWLYYHIEREIDELQVYLGQKWSQMDYIISITSAFNFTVILSAYQSNISAVPERIFAQSNLLIYLVALAAGLLAPVARNLLERFIFQR
jgi:hypothetical protein